MTYSEYQLAIFDAFINGKQNIIVNATAGSGKTTTGEHAIKQLIDKAGLNRFALNVLMCSFNVKIKEEFERRLKGYATCKTLHGIGFSMVPKPTAYWKINARKTIQKLWSVFDSHASTRMWPDMTGAEYKQAADTRNELLELIGLCKNNLLDWNNKELVEQTAILYNKPFTPLSLSLLPHFMEEDMKLSKKGQFDFDDLIYLPVICGVYSKVKYTHIIVDECQDLNPAQIALIKRIIAPNGVIMFVGDKYQSMYAFRGADPKAMERIQREFNCIELPLSISYRCPKSHIELAKKYCSTIEAKENAIEGIVENIDAKQFIEVVKDGELCLARVNSALVSYAMSLIAKGRKAVITGSEDFADDLVNLVKGFEVSGITEAINAVNGWRQIQVGKMALRKKDPSVIEDKADCIIMLMEGCTSLDAYYNRVANIFRKDIEGVIFSTIHRAKGLEAENVYILQPEKLPFQRKEQTEMEIAQEINITFVAYTRSKNRLVFVADTDKK